jgi:glutaminase
MQAKVIILLVRFWPLRMWSMSTTSAPLSTSQLPLPELVRALAAEAHDRFRSNEEGKNAEYIPTLAKVPSELFGICVVGTSGVAYAVGDTGCEFSIQSVSKPFVFALVCQAVGEDEVREKLGVNSTGLPFNSLVAIERTNDGRTNPIVNAGARVQPVEQFESVNELAGAVKSRQPLLQTSS